jgi:TolB protein
MTFVRSAFAVFALLLAASACNSDDLPPAAQFTALQGVVVDQATNQPVAGALVTVDAILTVTTDANGKFSIDKVPSGDFDYTIEAKGYATISGSGSAEPGKPLPLSVSLIHS